MHVFGFFVLSFILVSPLATASHEATHGFETSRSISDTREPDHRQVSQPGGALDGLMNRVTSSGAWPGDGSIFLDARFVAGALVYVGPPPLLDAREHMTPGTGSFFAWFGEWADVNEDGVIDTSTDATNEFLWRGLVSNEHVVMPFYLLPSNGAYGSSTPTNTRTSFAAWDDASDAHPDATFNDRTQGGGGFVLGSGATNTWLDESLLMTTQTITVAQAPIAPGSATLVDVRDARALVDVDEYGSLSPDAEALWVNAARRVRDDVVYATLAASNEGAREASAAYAYVMGDVVDPVVGPYLEDVGAGGTPRIVDDTLTPVLALASDADAEATRAYVDALGASHALRSRVVPPIAKEPNHLLDDYGARASLGVGDARGSFNGYDGYAAEYAFWFDAWPEMRVIAPANAPVPGTNENVGVHAEITHAGIDPVPASAGAGPDRGSGLMLSFRALVGLWWDKNGDHAIGEWCDIDDPDSWDEETGTCRVDAHAYYVNDVKGQPNGGRAGSPPPGGMGGEFIGTCGATTLRGSVIEVVPADADWPAGTLLMMDTAHAARAAVAGEWRVLAGREPARLRFDTGASCTAESEVAVTEDALFFPRGNSGVALLTTVEVSHPEWRDIERGFDVSEQRVRDVDAYAASL